MWWVDWRLHKSPRLLYRQPIVAHSPLPALSLGVWHCSDRSTFCISQDTQPWPTAIVLYHTFCRDTACSSIRHIARGCCHSAVRHPRHNSSQNRGVCYCASCLDFSAHAWFVHIYNADKGASPACTALHRGLWSLCIDSSCAKHCTCRHTLLAYILLLLHSHRFPAVIFVFVHFASLDIYQREWHKSNIWTIWSQSPSAYILSPFAVQSQYFCLREQILQKLKQVTLVCSFHGTHSQFHLFNHDPGKILVSQPKICHNTMSHRDSCKIDNADLVYKLILKLLLPYKSKTLARL